MQMRRFLLIVLLTLTVSIGLYATVISFTRPYTGVTLSVAGEISALDVQGPAALAGMQTNDRITAINGQRLDANRTYYEDIAIGDSVTYVVVRAGVPLSLSIIAVLTPPHAVVNRLVILTLGGIFWGFGFFLYLRNHPKFSTYDFIIFVVSGSAALFALEDAERGYLWARYTMYCALPISGAAWLNVHRNFPAPASRPWQLLCDLSYGIAVTITLVTLIGGPNALTQRAASMGFSPQLPSNVIRLIWSVECIAGFYLLVQGYRVQTGDTRRRVRFVVIGGLIGLVPVATILAAEAMNFYGIPNTIALMGLIALPVTYSISLTKADIIRLETRFYRTLIAGSLIVLVPLLYLGMVSVLNWMFPAFGASPLVGALIALLLTTVYSRVHAEVDLLFRRIFFGEKPNHFKQLGVLTDALKTLSSQLDSETVANLLTVQIPAEINVSKAGLWFTETEELVWKGGQITEKPAIGCLPDLGALEDSTLLKPRLLQSGDLYFKQDVRWWVPLVTSESGQGHELHGLWVLGPRENDESFSPSDIALINAASQECAIAVKAIRLLAQLRHQLKQTEAAWRRTIQIREEEQQRIANDLHDDVIQLVYSCGLNIQAAIRNSNAGKSPLIVLQRTGKLLDEIGEKTRLICYNLRPDTLTQLDLLSMLTYLVEETQSRTNARISLKVCPDTVAHDAPLDQLGRSAKIGLYRIVQEALNNVAKHACASYATVTVYSDTRELELAIVDDGEGFDLDGTLTSTRGGLGLATMQTRATDIHAALDIHSLRGEGTKIRISLPYCLASESSISDELCIA